MKMNEHIRTRHKKLKLTQTVLAKPVSVNRVIVTGWESGDYEPGGSNLQALVAVLRCNPHWLISDNGDPETEISGFKPTEIFGIKKIPVLSWARAGEWTESGQSVTTDDVSEWVYTAASLCDEGSALKVRGDSMTDPNETPSAPKGSLVVVGPGYGSTYEVSDKIVVAQIMGSTKATLKKFVIDGPIKYFVSLNPNYRMLEVNGSCRIVSIVRQVITDL